MGTYSMSFEECKAERAARSVTTEDKVQHLTLESERLRLRTWSDGEILAIPEDLVELAFQSSGRLQEEFRSLGAFQAYRRACAAGVARIAGRQG